MYVEYNYHQWLRMLQPIPDSKSYCFAIACPLVVVAATTATVAASVEYWINPVHNTAHDYFLDGIIGLFDLVLIAYSMNVIHYSYTHFQKYPIHCELLKSFSNKVYCGADNNVPTIVGDTLFPVGEDNPV